MGSTTGVGPRTTPATTAPSAPTATPTATTTTRGTTPAVDGRETRTPSASVPANGGLTSPTAGLAPGAPKAKPAEDNSRSVVGGLAGYAVGGTIGAGAAAAVLLSGATLGTSLLVYGAFLAAGTYIGVEHRSIGHAVQHAVEK